MVSLHAKHWPNFSNHVTIVNVVTVLYSAINFRDFMLSDEADEADLAVDVVVRAVRPSVLRILGGSIDTRPLDQHGPNQVEDAHTTHVKTLRWLSPRGSAGIMRSRLFSRRNCHEKFKCRWFCIWFLPQIFKSRKLHNVVPRFSFLWF